jgi:hypothetical protein
MNIYALLAKAQAKIGTIAKNNTATVKMKNGSEYSYDYVDLKSVIELIKPVCAEFGLSVVQSVENMELTTTIFCETGSVSSKCPAVANDKYYNEQVIKPTMQEIAGAITMARRYSLLNMFNIACSDDDASIASGIDAVIQPKQSQQSPRPTQTQAAKSARPNNFAPGAMTYTDYVIDFGKHKGKQLSDLGMDDLMSYVSFLEDSAKRDGKPLSQKSAMFVAMAQAYVNAENPGQMESANDFVPGPEDIPSFESDENIPF